MEDPPKNGMIIWNDMEEYGILMNMVISGD